MSIKSFYLATQFNAIKLMQAFKVKVKVNASLRTTTLEQAKCAVKDLQSLVNKSCYGYKIT